MDTLTKAIEHYQLPPLAPDRVSELEKYCRQLWSWNRRMNLTRHTDYDKFVARDLADTIQLSALIPPQQEVLDVGTGGGVPGISKSGSEKGMPDVTLTVVGHSTTEPSGQDNVASPSSTELTVQFSPDSPGSPCAPCAWR